MRIGVVSDSHGNRTFVLKAIKKMGQVDLLIHLGDLTSDLKGMPQINSASWVAVKGNCDYNSSYPEEEKLHIGGKTIYLTHGHLWGVKWGLMRLSLKAEEEGADCLLFGHTHMSQVFSNGRTVFFNPGSLGEPRGGQKSSFGIIEIKDGSIIPSIHHLDDSKAYQT